MTNGTRILPSRCVAFTPLSGSLLNAPMVAPPLSLVDTISVLSASPCASSLSSTLPQARIHSERHRGLLLSGFPQLRKQVQILLTCIHRRMHNIKRQINKEGPILVSLDELAGFITENLSQVAFVFLEAFKVALHPVERFELLNPPINKITNRVVLLSGRFIRCPQDASNQNTAEIFGKHFMR